MDPRTGVALIDTDPVRRASLRQFLASAGREVVLHASYGVEAIHAVKLAAPPLVFISFEEPLPRAIQAIEEVAAAVPEASIVAFTDEATTPAYQRAVRAGAGYLIDTPASAAELLAILEAVQPKDPRPVRTAGAIVVVAGQKGGIGKTTVSVNLASSLSKDNRGSVLLVDLDPDFGDAGILLDLNTNVSTARLAREQARLEFESFKRSLSLHESGAFLLGAPQSFSERLATSPEDVQQLLAFASQAFDYVLVDTPCMLTDTIVAALNAADVTLVTTTLEFGSLRNTTLLLQEMVYEGIRPERAVLVANNIDPTVGFSIGDAAEVLERDAIWEVPFDRAMPRSTQLGTPLTMSNPKSPASKSLRALASRLGEDPSRIDRRLAVRGEHLAPVAVRERLLSLVQPKAPAPVYSFSTAKRSSTYHLSGCKVERRLSARSTAPFAELPANLRPCRVCLPESAAA
jgi:pilus assembly protein CpaE